MSGNRRLAHDQGTEVLRHARGVRLGNTEKTDYESAVSEAEHRLGLR